MAIRARVAPEGASREDGAGTAAAEWPAPHVSGVRPATRLPEPETADKMLVSARVDTRSGLPSDESTPLTGTLAEFAAALPELLAPVSAASKLVLEQLVGPPRVLKELVLISPRRVHLAQRFPEQPEAALVSAADRGASLGWIVSEARARLGRR